MIKQPKNQHQLVCWYLLTMNGFSLREVINDSMFHKFQSRLSTLEKEYGQLAKRNRVKFTNRFGNSGSYFVYTAIDREKVKSVYNKISRIEVKKLT